MLGHAMLLCVLCAVEHTSCIKHAHSVNVTMPRSLVVLRAVCCVQADPRRLAKAEKAKAQGNEAFKQQKYRCDTARRF
jgi:hypothetical protein